MPEQGAPTRTQQTDPCGHPRTGRLALRRGAAGPGTARRAADRRTCTGSPGEATKGTEGQDGREAKEAGGGGALESCARRRRTSGRPGETETGREEPALSPPARTGPGERQTGAHTGEGRDKGALPLLNSNGRKYRKRSPETRVKREISTEISSRDADNDVVVCSVSELLDGALDEQEWREVCEMDQDMKSVMRAVVTGCIVIREEMCWDVHVECSVARLSWGTGENGTRNVIGDLNVAGQLLCSGRCGWTEVGAVNVGSEE
ncbi:hypothetical protein NDU88_007909 [Pleurodeles waltl]|uniref:Uncharacterized protein n=1 Tax=Pleurodeles waltl TaxID=8319 RepID=A0AAV7VUU2_PLEWA|nr:hypothetical protein NDU88_007909 [Pleurodeles waltl]